MDAEFVFAKNELNVARHGLPLAFGIRLFDDADHIVLSLIRAIDGEGRYKVVGLIEASSKPRSTFVAAKPCGSSWPGEAMMAKNDSTIALEADANDPEDFDVSVAGVDQALAERRARGGRPRGSNKEQVSLRLDHDVLERFRAGGPGWQTRINDALRNAVA